MLLERIRANREPRKEKVVTLRRRQKPPAPEAGAPTPEPLPLVAEPAVTYGATIPQRILAVMQPGREYSRAEITSASGISDAEWSWAIRQLKEEGMVAQMGERRGARYTRKD